MQGLAVWLMLGLSAIGATPAGTKAKNAEYVQSLLSILELTQSVDTFQVTLSLLEDVPLDRREVVPLVIRHAERLGIFADHFGEQREELAEAVGQFLEKLAARKPARKAKSTRSAARQDSSPSDWDQPQSRRDTKAACQPEAYNGRVLDQTIWNWYFEPGTERLTAGGLEHLAWIGRRKPQPDTLVFLQTAQDFPYDPTAPDKLAETRADLDARRIVAIKKVLQAQTEGKYQFEIEIHDPAEISRPSNDASAVGRSVLVPAWVTEPMEQKPEDRTPVIGEIRADQPPPLCEPPPSEAEILKCLPAPCRGIPYFYEEKREDVQVVTELLVDKIDPARFYPLVGPAQLHHCHWKCYIFYTEVDEVNYPIPFRVKRPRKQVVYIDKDRLHLYPGNKKSDDQPDPSAESRAPDSTKSSLSLLPIEKGSCCPPAYCIEPPDVLSLDFERLVPRSCYRIEPLDELNVRVSGVLTDRFTVTTEGTINLGSDYGTVRVAGLTLEEATGAIRNALMGSIKEPKVTVTLKQFRGAQAIQGSHLVNQDGTITLGSYGSVCVAGLTPEKAKAAIEKQLSKSLLNPEIWVTVQAFNSKFFYVITDGARYGQGVYRFPITGKETVLDAISYIGDIPTQDSLKKIWLARPVPGHAGCYQTLPVYWQAILQSGDTETNYQLFPGDRVYIKAEPLIQVDKLMSPLAPGAGIHRVYPAGCYHGRDHCQHRQKQEGHRRVRRWWLLAANGLSLVVGQEWPATQARERQRRGRLAPSLALRACVAGQSLHQTSEQPFGASGSGPSSTVAIVWRSQQA